jgi:hypothetical protein
MAYARLSAALFALSLAGPAAASQLSASVSASVTLMGTGGIAVITPLVMPSIQVGPGGSDPTFASDTPSAGTGGGSVSGNARLTVLRDSAEAVSVDVPPSFAVVRTGGGETLTVNTVTQGDLAVTGSGVLLGGGLIGGSAASVDIGGKLAMASSDKLVPGPYSGLFVVVVQYN